MLQLFHFGLMKRLGLALAFIFFMGFAISSIPAEAQTTLSAGDIAIIGMNADDPDEFAFVLLTNITSGTVINFTDNGWFSTNSFRTGEGTVSWTASSDMCAGTIVNTAVGTMLFAAAGDQILAYQGTSAAPTFIYALNNEGAAVWQADATSSNTSALPTGLTNGTSAFALTEIDNAIYTGTSSGTKAALLAAIATGTNWTTNDTVRQTMPSTNFTVTDAAPCGDNPPTVSSTVPTDGATAVSTSPTITITFNENVTATPGWFTIVCNAVDVSADFNDPGGTSVYTLTYTGSGLPGGANCVVTLDASLITDSAAQNLDGDSDTVAGGNYIFDFTLSTPLSVTLIHDIQGTGTAVTGAGPFLVEAIVTAVYQTPNAGGYLRGFFIQEEDGDADLLGTTSEGIFVFCSSCPVTVAVGDLVQVTGSASDFFNMSQLTASTAASVAIVSSGNPLPTAISIDLPVTAPDVNLFYEQYEGMIVSFSDTLTVSEYFELFRFGHIILYEGGRPYTFTHDNSPSTAGYTAHLDDLSRRLVILDDANRLPNEPIEPTGSQTIFFPQPNGLSIGSQGTDYFRGGDTVSNLTGILHWSNSGSGSDDAWRIRPMSSNPAVFTPVNTRPSAPALAGNIHVASFNVLNYFDAPFPTSRGADSAAEFTRQTDKLVQALAQIDADVFGLIEIENSGTTIAGLVASLNAVVGAGTYDYINTGVLGTDEITVALIYKPAVVQPVGSFLADTDPIHNRPPLAQAFTVVDLTNPDYGGGFTVIVNHFKSKSPTGASGANIDQNDGQGAYNATRLAQANALLSWINGTVIPTTGEDDVLIIGDLNSNRSEDPITALLGGGYTNLVDTFIGINAYSYVFDGQLGYLDHALGNSTMTAQVVGVADWHINADEIPLFDYNDEFLTTGESDFEEEPDGNPLYDPLNPDPYRTSDHDPVIIALDLAVTPPLAVQVQIAGSITGIIRSNNVQRIQILFNQALYDAGLDPDSVTNPDNYILFHSGLNGLLDTPPIASNFCALGANPVGDDIKITFAGVVYNTTTFNTTLNIEAAYSPLAQGDYLLVVCGSTSIVNTSLIPLDGDGNGIGGDDFSTTFTIIPPTGTTTGGSTGGGSGTIVNGGIDYDGDGIADVTQLPNTGESSIWNSWIVWAGALLLLATISLLVFGGKKQKN